jgi:hypothetical protein
MTATQGERVDAASALSQPRVEAGWLVPGPAQLVLGGTSVQPIDETPIEVDLLEERGSEVRVGVRLDHARFAVWSARAKLLGVLSREVQLAGSAIPGTPSVTLRTGARVHRLQHKADEKKTKIRYVGALEVEGWIADDAIGDRGPAGRAAGRGYGGRRSVMLPPGATIRSERQRNVGSLAVAHYSLFVEGVEQLADGWQRVAYVDSDVSATGYFLKTEPPSATHLVKKPDTTIPLTTNITVPADTCLYAGDEPVGFIVGDRAALVEASPRVGWFTVTIDSPWGPLELEANGPTETSLTKCAGASP